MSNSISRCSWQNRRFLVNIPPSLRLIIPFYQHGLLFEIIGDICRELGTFFSVVFALITPIDNTGSPEGGWEVGMLRSLSGGPSHITSSAEKRRNLRSFITGSVLSQITSIERCISAFSSLVNGGESRCFYRPGSGEEVHVDVWISRKYPWISSNTILELRTLRWTLRALPSLGIVLAGRLFVHD